MRKYLAICWMLALVFAAGYTPATHAASEAEETQVAEVVKGNTQFAFDLYSQLASSPGNLFFSPFSISTALAMTYEGAEGETEAQMQATLRLPRDGEPLSASFATLLQRFKGGASGQAEYTLTVANRLWGEKSYKFAKPFLAVLRDYYFSELTRVSFSKDSAGAVKTINDWVSKETQDKIRDLLQVGDVGPATRLILTNAVYFKGDWASPFKEESTDEAPFYLNANDQVPVSLMRQTKDFQYTETESFQALEMPYRGYKLSMVVLLPRERDGLSRLEQTLSADQLSDCLKTLQRRKVDVFLPRFKLTEAFHLKNQLIAMGMPLAFDDEKADFRGMFEGDDSLFISDIIHKAYVDVNEEGTEAAAATAAIVAAQSPAPVPEPRPVFRADHPFIFLIRDNSSGSILFLGRVVNPGK